MTMLRMLVRVDARRPAAWLALGAAGLAVALLALFPIDRPTVMVAWLVGACLAAAAIGAPLPAPAGTLVPAGAWVSARLAWPALGGIVGAALGGVAARLLGSEVEAASPLEVILLSLLSSIALTGEAIRQSRRRGAPMADAMSLALLLAGAAAVCGGVIGRRWNGSGPAAWVILVLGWAATASVARWGTLLAAESGWVPMPVGGPHGDVLVGRLRRWLHRVAMAVALGGMVVWLFLSPDEAMLTLWVSAGCAVALAVPAILPPGGGPGISWSRLARSSPVAATATLPLLGGSQEDGAGGLSSPWMVAAILAWPPLVSAGLAGGEARRVAIALCVTVVVAATAAIVTGLRFAARNRCRPETALALGLIASASALVGAARFWAG